MPDTAAATPPIEWTVRPPIRPQPEEREATYRGLGITVREWGFTIQGRCAGLVCAASRTWFGADCPDTEAMADAAIVAADELVDRGWTLIHEHTWRQHDDGRRCTGCGAEE